jgi:hypothetical protein
VDAQFSIPVTLSLRQLPTDHGPGVGHRLPYHLHASDKKNRLLKKDSPHWRGNTDPAVIKQVLAHLERKSESKEFKPIPESSTRRA